MLWSESSHPNFIGLIRCILEWVAVERRSCSAWAVITHHDRAAESHGCTDSCKMQSTNCQKSQLTVKLPLEPSVHCLRSHDGMGLWIVFRSILASSAKVVNYLLPKNGLLTHLWRPQLMSWTLSLDVQSTQSRSIPSCTPVYKWSKWSTGERKVECSRHEVRAQATFLLIANQRA